MATKKQKRAAGLAKREQRLEEARASGLAAQLRDKQEQEAKAKRYREEAERINHRFGMILAAHHFANG